MVLSKRRGESILNIIGSLSGSAWRLVEDFDVSKAEQESSFNDILKILDKHFQYDDRVALPTDFDAYFQLLRKPGQTMLNYVTEHDELHRRLDRHSVSLPLKVQGWHLLRRSGLNRDQRQMVMLKAPLLEKKDVIEALYLIFGQDHKAGNTGDRPRHYHRGKGGKHRGYYVDEESGYYHDDDFEDDGSYEMVDDYGYYEGSAYDEASEQPDEWVDDELFDHGAGYFHGDDQADDWDTPFPVESYDEAYAAYVDARKRFSDLRLSRGFLPVVALSDPSAGNLSPGLSSPGGSPSSSKGKKGGKGFGGGKGKGKGKNIVRYSKPPPKPHETRAKGKTLTCLRCGRPGHFASECTVPKSVPSSASGSNKRSASTLEAMAKFEDAHVTFVDSTGQERHDVTLLDPGASAFLCGYGPLARYLNFLQLHGFPVPDIEFNRCCRRFQFGGDGSSWSHWVVRLPLCISGVLGRAQVFLVKGETPLLCGRPIIEALGIDLAFSRQAIRYRDGPWMPATLGLQGEYLLPLWEPSEDLDFSNLDFQFDLIVADEGEVDPKPCSLRQFEQEEHALLADGLSKPQPVPSVGERLLRPRQLQTFDVLLQELQNDAHAYLTYELHSRPTRVIWEVYCGNARTSTLAETLGAHVETFSYATGWNFNIKSHRDAFLARLQSEVPDAWSSTCPDMWPLESDAELGSSNLWTEDRLARTSRVAPWDPPAVRQESLPHPGSKWCSCSLGAAYACFVLEDSSSTATSWLLHPNAGLEPDAWTLMDFGNWSRSLLPFWLPNVSSSMRWVFDVMEVINTVCSKVRPLELVEGLSILRTTSLDLLLSFQHVSCSMRPPRSWTLWVLSMKKRSRSVASSSFWPTTRPMLFVLSRGCIGIWVILTTRSSPNFWPAEVLLRWFWKLLGSSTVWLANVITSRIPLPQLRFRLRQPSMRPCRPMSSGLNLVRRSSPSWAWWMLRQDFRQLRLSMVSEPKTIFMPLNVGGFVTLAVLKSWSQMRVVAGLLMRCSIGLRAWTLSMWWHLVRPILDWA